MSFTKSFLLFLSFIVSVTALTTPHVHRAVHHRALAGRIAVPEPLEVPVTPARRRRDAKRCKPRPSSATSSRPAAEETIKSAQQLTPSTTTSHAAPTTTIHAAPTTTTYAAPKPPPPAPTTQKPAPTTTKEQPPPPTTTNKPSPPPSSNLPSFMVGTQTGQGTWYGTGLGACGITNTDSDHIAAASHLLFDIFPGYNGVNPNNNPICGRKVTAHYQGKSVTVAITDRCAACQETDLDFSPSAFEQLASLGVGRLSGMTWEWDE